MHANSPLRITCMATLALLITVGAAQALRAQPQRGGIPLPEETRLPEEDVVATMHRFHRLPMVELTLNGKGPYRLIVDTGAAGVVITPELAEQLELPSPPGIPDGMQIQVRTPGGPVSAALRYIDEVALGEAQFRGVWSIVTEMPFGDGMDGVIGMNVFKECLLTYDYPQDRLVLSHGELPEPDGIDVFSYETPRMPDSHPVIELSVNGQPTPAMLDTGMRGWFAAPRDSLEELALLHGPAAVGMGMSVGEAQPSDVAQLQGGMGLGPHIVKDPVFRVGTQFMLGTMYLEHFAVTFDGRNKRLRLAREGDGDLVQPLPRNLGFGLRQIGDDMIIWYVQPGSHAAEAGFEEGGIVLELNGQPARDVYESPELLDAIQQQPSIAVRYQPKDGLPAKDVTLRVFDPFDAERSSR